MTFSTRSTCNPSGRLCGQSSATCLSKLLMCFFGTLPISDSAIRFVFGHALRLLGCKWWWSHLKIGASGRWDLHCFYLCRSHFTCADWQVYLSPFVKAMSPPEAAALRPLLEKKASSFCTSSQYIWHENCEGWLPVFKQAVDDIYYDMDMDHTADISSDEMLSWSKRGNNIVDRLADIIDQEVYQIWLTESKKKVTNMRRSYDSPGSPHSGVLQPTRWRHAWLHAFDEWHTVQCWAWRKSNVTFRVWAATSFHKSSRAKQWMVRWLFQWQSAFSSIQDGHQLVSWVCQIWTSALYPQNAVS